MLTYVISVIFQDQKNKNYDENEFLKLASSLGVIKIKKNAIFRISKRDPAFFISKGHLKSIKNCIMEIGIGLGGHTHKREQGQRLVVFDQIRFRFKCQNEIKLQI